MLQSEQAAIPGFGEWYPAWQARMRQDPILAWLKDARNTVVKQGDLETASMARASILAWTEHCFGEVTVPPFAPLVEFALWMGAGLLPHLPAPLRAEAVLVVERRWEVPDLPGHELLDALAQAFGALARLVEEAHQRCGAEFELFGVDVNGVRQLPTEHLGGRYPCMAVTRETRSVRVNLRTGEVYGPTVVTPKQYEEAAGETAARRYKLRDVKPSASSGVFGFAETMGEVAKQMLRRDGYLIPTALLLRGEKLVQLSELRFDDQQEKFLVWQHIADDVRRHGADGLVFIGESWLSRGEGLARGVRPSEARDREEAIHVFAAKSTGEMRSLMTPFSRGRLRKIKLGKTHEVREVAYNFFAPVRAVWLGTSPSGAPASARAPGCVADPEPKG
jgi:hypothetical protein